MRASLIVILSIGAFAENVVAHGDYREKGYAAACVNYAKNIAQENYCCKMMLLTGA